MLAALDRLLSLSLSLIVFLFFLFLFVFLCHALVFFFFCLSGNVSWLVTGSSFLGGQSRGCNVPMSKQ